MVLQFENSIFIHCNLSSCLQFRRYTDQDITKNYAHDDIVITAGRAALAFVLLLSFPLLVVPCRQTLNKVSASFYRQNANVSLGFH